jgi:hypothetical protein
MNGGLELDLESCWVWWCYTPPIASLLKSEIDNGQVILKIYNTIAL